MQTHKGLRCLFVAGCEGSPLLQPGPDPLDHIALGVDPVGAGNRGLISLGWDSRPRAHAPDALAEPAAGIAAVGRNPGGDATQAGLHR